MAKRKLSLQQQRRIADKHRPDEQRTYADTDGAPGLVICRFRHKADIMATDGPNRGGIVRCHIRANIQDIVTGDRVRWLQESDGAVVTAVLPRESLMARPDAKGMLRPVAANVTRIAIVIATQPQPHQNLVDRYLVAAEHLGIQPFILINKIDLLRDDDHHLPRLLALYRQLGYPVIEVSATTGQGMAELRAALADQATVFVGQSGVGKSSLINLIHPAAEAAIGELSEIAKGRHTTTTATLYCLASGGYLIDSPGIREFGLWHLEQPQIASGFIEFRPHLGHCKFRDCRHFSELGCSILEACQAGAISRERHASYQQIVNDLNPD